MLLSKDTTWRDSISLRSTHVDGIVDVSTFTDISARTTAFTRGPTDTTAVLCTCLTGGKKGKAQAHIMTLGKGRGGTRTVPLPGTAACVGCNASGCFVVGQLTEPLLSVACINPDTLVLTTQNLVSVSLSACSSVRVPVSSLDVGPESVVVAGVGSTTVFVDASEGEIVLTLPGPERTTVRCCRWLGNGNSVSLLSDGALHVLDPRGGAPTQLRTHNSMTRLCGSPSVPHALWVAGDACLSLYDLRVPTAPPVVTTPTLQSGVVDVCASYVRPHLVATCAGDGTVKLWSSERRVPILNTSPHDTYPVGLCLSSRSALESITTCGALGDCVVQRLTPEFLAPIAYHGCPEKMPLAKAVEVAMYIGNVAEAHEHLPSAVSESRQAGCAEDGLKLLALCTKCNDVNKYTNEPLLDILQQMSYYSLPAVPWEDTASVDESSHEVVERLRMNMLLALYIQNKNAPAVLDSIETLIQTVASGGTDVDVEVISDCLGFLINLDHGHGLTTAQRIVEAIFDSELGEHSMPLLHGVVMTALKPLAIDDASNPDLPLLRTLYQNPTALSGVLELIRTVVHLAGSKRDSANAIIATIAAYEGGVESDGNISVLAIPSLPLIMLYINSLLQQKDIASFLWMCAAYADRYCTNNKKAQVIQDTLHRCQTSMQSSILGIIGEAKQLCTHSLSAAGVEESMVLLGRMHSLQIVFVRCLRCLSMQQQVSQVTIPPLLAVLTDLQKGIGDLIDSWEQLLDRFRTHMPSLKRAAMLLQTHKAEISAIVGQTPHNATLGGGIDHASNILKSCAEFAALAK